MDRDEVTLRQKIERLENYIKILSDMVTCTCSSPARYHGKHWTACYITIADNILNKEEIK